MNHLKLIAFDVLSLCDLSNVDRADMRKYHGHIADFLDGKPWTPIDYPPSWEAIAAYPDVAPGIAKLRERFTVVALSNLPVRLISKISRNSGIAWDSIVPLEMKRTYKPCAGAFTTVCELFGVGTHEVAMVTANGRPCREFNDLEAAAKLGMTPFLLRDEKIPTVVDLAAILSAK
jgi:FMN phosphatase YigB (HAD superfamily)